MSSQALDLDGPALPAPEGVESDFNNSDNLFGAYVATIVICFSFATILVLIRMYTRIFIIKAHAPDDWLCFASWALFAGLVPLTGLYMHYSQGRRQWDIRLRDFLEASYWLFFVTLLYNAAYALVKISLLIQLRRIFVPQSKASFMWWSTWTVTIAMVLFYSIKTFIDIFRCRPLHKAWRPIVPGHCLNVKDLYLGAGIFNTITDMIILALPQRSVHRLRLPIGKRVGVITIYSIGIMACIASIIRLYYTARTLRSKDVAYALTQQGFWAYAELTCGIICACLPILPRFLQHVKEKSKIWSKVSASVNTLSSRGTKSSQEATKGQYQLVSFPERVFRQSSQFDGVHHSESRTALNPKESSRSVSLGPSIEDSEYQGHMLA